MWWHLFQTSAHQTVGTNQRLGSNRQFMQVITPATMSTKYHDYSRVLQENLDGHLPSEAITSLRKQIDFEIGELKARLLHLAQVRNALAPVYRLPREVLEKIFDLVRMGENGRALVKRILTASWVSQHWRDVALGYPMLWDHIDRSNCRWAIWCLIRSRSVPLFIDLSDDATEILSSGTTNTIFRELPRIHLLRLGGSDSELDGRRWDQTGNNFPSCTELDSPEF